MFENKQYNTPLFPVSLRIKRSSINTYTCVLVISIARAVPHTVDTPVPIFPYWYILSYNISIEQSDEVEQNWPWHDLRDTFTVYYFSCDKVI